CRLLQQRVRFLFHDESGAHAAQVGIPFGAAIACLFANIYLTGFDREIERIRDVHYFRYADDLLVLSPVREAALLAQECLDRGMEELRLRFKSSLQADLLLSASPSADVVFAGA